MNHEILREQIDQLIASSGATKARNLIGQLWRENPGPAVANFVLSRLEKLQPNPVSCRLAILRSFTAEPITPVVRAAAAVEGIDLTVQVGAFNAYAQELL